MPALTTIGFDADDTLWHNERFFQLTEARFREMLADHAGADLVSSRLLEAERRNLGHYGFGIKGFVEFAKSFGKVVFATVFLVFVMSDVHARLLAGMVTNPVSFGLVIRDIAVELITTVAFAMALIAGADLLWSRFHWLQELRMSKQEVKDEQKQAEGDPILKARMRSLARDRARQRMMSAVPRATLIIANPTHYSIALRYVREETAAPIVVAKGQDLIALKIREIAEENNIPVFEDVTLARSMFKQVSVDNMIPPQFYHAVAELIRIIQSGRKGPKPGNLST